MVKGAQQKFIQAIKGKVIMALLLACFALFMAWAVSRIAFKEMLATVDNISAPNERLRIVSSLSRKISGMDQLQKTQASRAPGNYTKVFQESKQLRLALDTLGFLYQEDTVQLGRIASIRHLLTLRDQQFVNYLKEREKLVNNRAFSEQVRKLNDLTSRKSNPSDSTVVTSIKKTSTTTIFPTEEEQKPRGFFSKLFGRKKSAAEQPYKIINEENIKRDTIALSAEGKIVRDLEASLKNIEKEQRLKSARFMVKEAELAEANGLLINQMLNILRKVESEAVAQIELNSLQAKSVVSTGINRISIIMLVFFFLMVILLYLILTDITRSNRYRKELELARDEAEYHGKAKQRFLSNMSHEIRTPLQSIIGYSEMIRQQEHPQHKDLDAIHHSAEHLLQIVNEVLDYNRIVSGKFTFSNQVFSMPALLEEVVAVMRPQAAQKVGSSASTVPALQLKTDLQLQGIAQVEGDPFRLKQILFNLLGNAIKFTKEGEVVLAALYKKQGSQLHFTFRVSDTGIGFSEEDAQHIFNEFEQAENPDKNLMNQAGTGLGLTIVKSLVEQQGGRIYVSSKVGAGSVFTVYLTFNQVSADAGSIVKYQPGIALTSSKVWIVDDDQLILDLCSIIFEKNDISYTSFNSPLALLNAKWDPDVKFILMDIRMPEMSGIELCKILRKKSGPELGIYAITAQVLPEERAYLLDQGFDGLIMKPFREHEILSIFKEEEVLVVPEVANDGVEFDPSGLEKMTFGDREALQKILDRFALDSAADAEELLACLEHPNPGHTVLLLHRLAGRIAQMGARQLAAGFRKMEIEMGGMDKPGLAQVQEIKSLLGQLKTLLHQVADYSIS
ncbi:response regulator [Pedobacter sp. MC2016-14]|uniref:hybrid sensor histidine kinase/response regulator n=1 Tax=Pedobacter sp. MC2016-14 TaxID=2897327 RepID=UPI001E369E12|nr:ATP-binding protein [Pedobacter sp. MC2016-14]MCD0486784.1 response regulator [Pedobacter sp. MC2016-14]